MEIIVTLMIRTTITAQDPDSYECKRDKIIQSLEDQGFFVNLEKESEDDEFEFFLIEDEYEDDDDDNNDDDDDESSRW